MEIVVSHYNRDQAGEMEKANELQEKMIEVIERNNAVTSKHNTAIRWLTVCLVVVSFFTILSNFYRNNNGRYAISPCEIGVYILDTKTSEVWLRAGKMGNVYLGTNNNPTGEKIDISNKAQEPIDK